MSYKNGVHYSTEGNDNCDAVLVRCFEPRSATGRICDVGKDQTKISRDYCSRRSMAKHNTVGDCFCQRNKLKTLQYHLLTVSVCLFYGF